MITLSLFSREEISELLEAFNVGFLREPFKRPSKAIQKYVVKGFRPDKLTEQQLNRMYVNALCDGNIVLSDYVKNNIARNFEEAGISDVLLESQNDDSQSIAKLSLLLWENGLYLPVHFAMKLVGRECSDEFVKISCDLHKFYHGKCETLKEQFFSDGYERSEKHYKNELEKEQKKSERAKEAKERVDEKYKSLEEEYSKACATANQLSNEKIIRDGEIESLKKQITKSENEAIEKDENINRLNNSVREYREEISKLKKEIAEIDSLKEKLKIAEDAALSDKTIEQLCMDVLDEIKGSSMSKDEVLELAKKVFSSEDSVVDGWKKISNKSDVLLEKISIALMGNDANEKLLDDFEEIENCILIEFSLLKSMKAILFGMLERLESSSTLTDAFEERK